LYFRKQAEEEGCDDDDDESDEDEGEKNILKNYQLRRGQSAKDIPHCPCCKVGLWKPEEPQIRSVHGVIFSWTV